MTLDRYLEGVLLLAVALVPLHTASYLWRARLVGEWSGAQARLAEIIADVTVVVCISEILGTVRLYRLAPVVIALATTGLAAIWAARRVAVDRPETVESPPASGPKPRTASGERGGARRRIRGRSRVEHRDGVRLPPRDVGPGHALVSHALCGSICPRRVHHDASLLRLATPRGLLSCIIGALPLIRHSVDGQRRLVTPHQYPVARSCTAGVVVHWAPLWGGAGHADGLCDLVRHPGPGGDAAGRCLRRRCRPRAAALVRCPSHQFEERQRSIRADSLGDFGGGRRPRSGYEVHI